MEYNHGDLYINDLVSANLSFDLPSKVLVSAFSFNDKYPLREQRGKVINDNYYYLGLKSTTNNIFIGNPTKNAIANLYNALINNKDIAPLQEAFETLELRPELKLVYKPGKYFKFLQNDDFWDNKNISRNEFHRSFTDFLQSKRVKTSRPELKRLGNEKIEKILGDEEKVQAVLSYLHDNIRLITEIGEKEISLKPTLVFNRRNSFQEFTRLVLPFQLLSDLEIISFERFEIKKLNTNFSFDDASSGEYHIILSFLNILCLIEEGSLVLLDEPEISLHPNWQIKYMTIFYKVFSKFPKSHYVIASHSHFIVSDLQSENSTILSIDVNEEGNIQVNSIEKNTYGWSAEQILVDVFKVPSTRNFYISKTVTDVLKEMGETEPDYASIKSKLEKIIFLDTKDFNEHDPLLDIFKELKIFYDEELI